MQAAGGASGATGAGAAPLRAPGAASSSGEQAAGGRRWGALAVVALGNFMSALDTFIVNIAIPSLRRDLHATPGEAELVVTVYALTFAVLLITGGRLGDLFGRTRVYLVGMGIFTAASALSGAAPTPAVLIGARVLQAAGAAIMVPQAYSVVQRVFGPDERMRAIALLTMVGSVAVVFAQVVGGALIQANVFGTGWRIVFFINVPVGVIGILAGLALLPRTRPERTSVLDIPGVVLVSIALLMVVVPLTEGRDLRWPLWLLCILAVSPLAIALFLWQQRRRAASKRFPLIDLSLFRERAFSAGAPMGALNQITNAGLFFVLAIYLQSGRGLFAGLAGLAFSPIAFGYMVVAPWAPRLSRRFGRGVISVGYLTVAAAVASAIIVLRVAGPGGSPFDLVPSTFFIGAGQGFVNSPLYGTVLSRVRRGQEGSASGIMTTMQQTGGSIGIALEGLVFFSALGTVAAATRFPAGAATTALSHALWLNLGFDLLGAVVVRFLPGPSRAPAGGAVPVVIEPDAAVATG